MDGGAWWAAVYGVTKSRTRLSNFTFTFHFHALEKEMATHSSVLAWRIPGTGEPGGLPSMGSHKKWLSSSSSSSMSNPVMCSTAWEYLVRNFYQSSWSEKANWTLRPVLSKKTANKEGKDPGNSELRQKHCFHTFPSMFNSEFSQASTNRSISKQQDIHRIFVMLYGCYKHTVVL